VQLHAAQGLLTRAARAVDAAEHERTPERAGEASVAVAEAKAFGGEVAVTIASDLFALAGTAAADEGHNLHRHWRNARTITLHDPARWKYHHVGNHLVNGAFPPPSAFV
jgi:alkylation response protein AidB-like acyl-CoA dehydrogenase